MSKISHKSQTFHDIRNEFISTPNITKEQKDNREHFEYYFKYIPNNVSDVVRTAYESGFHLLSLNDLSDEFNAGMYLECSKYHKVEYIPPYPEISFVNSMELLFIKK